MMQEPKLSSPEAFEFEKSIDVKGWLKWFDECWYYSVYASGIYIIVTFALRYYMKNRQPYTLRRPLLIWNLSLALFSICGTCRMLPGFIHILKEFGFTFSVCDNIYGYRLQASLFWGLLFLGSKVFEFGDTLFIILRKRKLLTLHWYHHAMTLVGFVYGAKFKVALSHWVAMINYSVHAIMYSYYTLNTMNIKFPRYVPMTITTIQIAQLLTGMVLMSWVVYLQTAGYTCYFPEVLVKMGTLGGISYLLLFLNYFYKTYFYKCKELSKKLH